MADMEDRLTVEPLPHVVQPYTGTPMGQSPAPRPVALPAQPWSTAKVLLIVFGGVGAAFVALIVAVVASVVLLGGDESAPVTTGTPVAEPAPRAPEVNVAAEVQSAIDVTGGWGETWSPHVVGLDSTGAMVTVETNLWNKPENETDARFLCAFTATVASEVSVPFDVRVAASDGASLATCSAR